MRRPALTLTLIGPACALAVLLIVYRAVLFEGEQFAYRDASQYYYPLHQRVQKEWQAGRWPPLWDPWRNGGQPLLGNPTAAVLYPGKLVFAVLPDAWAARFYVIGHTALAFAGMLALARSLGISATGASVAALAYAFGAPVLFQYDNVIYLVGAAWTPWALRFVDRLVRLNEPLALPALAVVLALQILGGDLQNSYLILLCGAGYSAWRAVPFQHLSFRYTIPISVGLIVAWIVSTLAYAWLRPTLPGWIGPVWAPALLAWLALVGWSLWEPDGTRRRSAVGSFRSRAPARWRPAWPAPNWSRSPSSPR